MKQRAAVISEEMWKVDGQNKVGLWGAMRGSCLARALRLLSWSRLAARLYAAFHSIMAS